MSAWVVAYALLLARVAAFVTVGPWRYAAPSRLVRVGMAVGLSFAWLGHAETRAEQLAYVEPTVLALVLLSVQEVLIGAAAGYVAYLFLLPAQFAGDLVGRQMGLSLGQLADPATRSPTALLAQVFQLLALAVYFGLNVHHAWLLLLDDVIRRWPTGAAVLFNVAPAVTGMQRAYASGVSMVGPLVLVGFSLLLIVSLLNKAAAGFNYFSVGLGFQIFGGLVALLVFVPSVCHALRWIAYDWLRWAHAVFR